MQTNNDISVNRDLNAELLTGKANPLNIPEITDHMFQFLKLSDIKNCRSVCQKWNQLTDRHLKKLSVVNISKPEQSEKFNEVFPQSQIFTCFRFDGFQLPLYKSVSFFKKWYHNFSEIELFRVDFDFGLNLGNEPLDLCPLLPSTLIKLQIKSCRPATIVSNDKICNIRVLELENSIINIMPGSTLNNVQIALENVTFRENSENIEEFLINSLLNFNILKKASFSGRNIKLDLQGSHSLDLLKLQKRVAVLNWETSNWTIKKLFLGVYPCKDVTDELSRRSQIKCKELEFRLRTHLDVSLLPEGIEILKVRLHPDKLNQDFPPRIYGEHNFPDLKNLVIIFQEGNDFDPFVEFFKNCPKLTNLTVACYPSNDEISLKMSTVPPTVKTLRVILDVRIILDRGFQLDSLILYDAHCDGQFNIVDIVSELHVKNLYWFGEELEMKFGGYGGGDIFCTENGNQFKSLLDLHLDNLVVGEFPRVTNSEFIKSYLFPFVDTQGKYYLFQRGGIGKAISGSHAIQLSKR